MAFFQISIPDFHTNFAILQNLKFYKFCTPPKYPLKKHPQKIPSKKALFSLKIEALVKNLKISVKS
jgi:hypothetical protein